MELLKAYLKERRLTLAAFLLFVGMFAVSFALYGLPLAAVGYPAGLCVLLGACLAPWMMWCAPLCGGLPGSSLTGASRWTTRQWNGRR